MPEYGEGKYRHDVKPVKNQISEYTDNWESSLVHVYANEETKALITNLIKRAKSRFEEDPSWLDKLKTAKHQLDDTDEEEEIKTILKEALGDEIDEDDGEETSEEPEDEEI